MDVERIDENTFRTCARGSIVTLTRRSGGWRVAVENGTSSARCSLAVKEFDSLDGIEKHYKSLRGISLLIAADATFDN